MVIIAVKEQAGKKITVNYRHRPHTVVYRGTERYRGLTSVCGVTLNNDSPSDTDVFVI